MSKTDINHAVQLQGRTVTITGGLGFIGSNLARELVGAGAKVQIIDSLLPEYGGSVANLGEAASKIKIHQVDLLEPAALPKLLENQEVIFSLAGQTSHIDSMRDPRKDLQINVEASVNLLEGIRHACPKAVVVFTSTRQVYGRPQFLPVTESHPIQPVDVNGINKLAAEYYYQLYHQIYGTKAVVLRLTNTYGPRMDLPNNGKGFVGIFVRKGLRKEKISIFGDGMQRRDFNHVNDVCSALVLAATTPKTHGQTYNLGYPRAYTLLEFTELLTEQTQSSFELVAFPPEHKAIDIGDYYGSFDKFTADTGWQPVVDLAEGLKGTVAFHRVAL